MQTAKGWPWLVLFENKSGIWAGRLAARRGGECRRLRHYGGEMQIVHELLTLPLLILLMTISREKIVR